MKISYISLRKKLKEFQDNKKEKKEKKEKLKKAKQDSSIDEAKFIGINYSKKDTKEKERILNNLKKAPKGSYLLTLFMIFLLVITTRVNIDTYSKLSEENYETYTLQDEEIAVSNNNVVIYQEAVSSVYEVSNEYVQSIEASSGNIIETNKDVLEDEVYVYEYTYIRPVEGETIKEYSMDKVIYSKTLDMWKTHDGIDIGASIGAEVKACEKGTVERVYQDTLYGYSVLINHQNGIKTIYRNLDNEILVKEKDEVNKGDIIGRVGRTANSECKDDSHLHFEVVQNSQIVNPSIIGIK